MKQDNGWVAAIMHVTEKDYVPDHVEVRAQLVGLMYAVTVDEEFLPSVRQDSKVRSISLGKK